MPVAIPPEKRGVEDAAPYNRNDLINGNHCQLFLFPGKKQVNIHIAVDARHGAGFRILPHINFIGVVQHRIILGKPKTVIGQLF